MNEKFTTSGEFLVEWGQFGTGDGEFDAPEGVELDDAGTVYVVDSGNDRVQQFAGSGNFRNQWGRPGTGNGGSRFR